MCVCVSNVTKALSWNLVLVIAGSPATDMSPLLADGVGAEHQWYHHAQQMCGERNGKVAYSFGGGMGLGK